MNFSELLIVDVLLCLLKWWNGFIFAFLFFPLSAAFDITSQIKAMKMLMLEDIWKNSRLKGSLGYQGTIDDVSKLLLLVCDLLNFCAYKTHENQMAHGKNK